MIFSRLENIELEKRTNLRVGSSDFISLNPLKTFFPSSGVSDVLMIESTPVIVPAFSVIATASPVIMTASLVMTTASPVMTTATSVMMTASPVMMTASLVMTTESSVMMTDKNKNITSIKYNYLNLPTMINFLSGDFIEYKYNAGGQKISKFVSSVNTNNTVKLVEYLDGFQYTGEELNFFPHAEGYVNVTLGTTGNRIFNYVYNYTDHLGNIRLSYTKDMVNNQLKILEENNYYPFGLKHQKYSSAGSIGLKAVDENTARPANLTSTPYAYKYNGQEWQDELGLNMYDMDMRQYDPAIARWVVLDPVIHHSMSPYNAFDNNPVFWADPSGADSVFDQGGVSASSITVMGSGLSISAGGSQGQGKTETRTAQLIIGEDNPQSLENLPDGTSVSGETEDFLSGQVVKTFTSSKTTYTPGVSSSIGLGSGNSFMSTALSGYQGALSTPSGRNYYNNLHNSKLSKSVDNAVMGTIITVAMLPLAAEFGGMILLKYSADVTMQYVFSGEVNFLNAAVGSLLPGSVAPIGSELSDVTQKQAAGKEVNLMQSTLNIGTGYLGNALGNAASATSLGNNGSEILQAFHNNLQAALINHNMQ